MSEVIYTDGVPDCQSSPGRAQSLTGGGILAAIHLNLEVVRPGEGVGGLRVERQSLPGSRSQHYQPPPGLGHAVVSGLENLES